jgi:glycosyltransferase involved in cell wall biosynthesis
MKVMMLSKALVAGAYQKKLEELARFRNITLIALVPPYWREPHVGVMKLERKFSRGYRLQTLPMVANGRHHLHFYPGLPRILAEEKPDILHIDEEAFNLATFLALRAGLRVGARCCFYNWANMNRWYPPPFSWFEKFAFRKAAHAICGNQEAVAIIQRHGYQGPVTVLPQFGVDPTLFTLAKSSAQASNPDTFTVGYLGRLVAAKGLLDLLDAMVQLPENVRLRLVGNGDLRPRIEQRARQLGIAGRVEVLPAVPSTQVPTVLHGFDVLVLPSRTMPNWKEQFGRVLIEAMSCGVPVVGSDSGEIANVIGDGGIVFPERNVAALRDALLRLLEHPDLRRDLGQRGRERVLANYTHAILAGKYYNVYRQMLNLPVVELATLMKHRKAVRESHGTRR